MSERSEEDRILAIFDHFDRCAREAEYRGCPLTHASFQAAEANGAVYAVVKAYKRELREHVFRALGPGRRNRAELADQLLLLLDGAVIEVYLKGVADPMAVAKLAATTLLRTPQ